jgi:hypothetical protein
MAPDVRLRPVQKGDLPTLYLHQRDPEAVRMAAFPSRDEPAFQAHWARLLADDSLVKQAVLVDGKLAGHVACFGPAGGGLLDRP